MSILDTATKAYELVKKAGNIEAQELVMLLREAIVELQAINITQAKELQANSNLTHLTIGKTRLKAATARFANFVMTKMKNLFGCRSGDKVEDGNVCHVLRL